MFFHNIKQRRKLVLWSTNFFPPGLSILFLTYVSFKIIKYFLLPTFNFFILSFISYKSTALDLFAVDVAVHVSFFHCYSPIYASGNACHANTLYISLSSSTQKPSIVLYNVVGLFTPAIITINSLP